MLEKERLLFLLLLVLGTSIISARYLEDSSEDRHADHEQAEELKNESDMDDENDGKDDDEDFKNDEEDFESNDADGNNKDADEDDSREEVVKIQPGQSDEGEQEDEDTSEDEGDEFGDEGDATDDHMIEGDEGGRSLADQQEDTENVADQGGFEDFKKTADEIARENENIEMQIKDLQDKFDQALSSDSDKSQEGRDLKV